MQHRVGILDVAGLFLGPALIMGLLMAIRVPEDVAGSISLIVFLVWASWLVTRLGRRSR